MPLVRWPPLTLKRAKLERFKRQRANARNELALVALGNEIGLIAQALGSR
jgi:hypothetical protein